MRLYKLTDAKGQTLGETQWGPNVTHKADMRYEPMLCTGSVIHAYRMPWLAVLMNPVHACFLDPILWEAEGDVVADDGTKVGCRTLTTLGKIPLPRVPTEERVEIAIRCAMSVYKNRQFTEWASNWLEEIDKTAFAANAAQARARFCNVRGGKTSLCGGRTYASASAISAAAAASGGNGCSDAIAHAARAVGLGEVSTPLNFIEEIIQQVQGKGEGEGDDII